MKKLLLVFFLFSFQFSLFAQIGGSSTFEFLNLNTSPRIIALGGYLTSILDDDINNGIYNPALINSSMLYKSNLNYTNYYTDILYGDVGYCFNLAGYNFISSIKFIDYGQFVETDLFGNRLGEFSAGEYMVSLGSSMNLDSLFSLGLTAKIAYSSLYELSSLGFLIDFGFSYMHPKKDLVASLIIKNLGYQIVPYYNGSRESMPFEIVAGISNKLAHMPLRWHLTIQHLETPNLSFDNTNLTVVGSNDNIMSNILMHIVVGAEFLIHRNASLLIGYNNRRRFEMIIEDRRGLVGFSFGFSFRVKRFHFNYSRTLNHFSGGVNSFGITTNLKKND